MFDTKIVFNIVWISVVLVIAYFGIRKEWLKEKEKERQIKERAQLVDKALEKEKKSYLMQYIPLPEINDFPSIEKVGFELVDLAWNAIEYPPDPPLPKLGIKRQIISGKLVRLGVIFEPQSDPEYIWVAATAPVNDLFSGTVLEGDDPSVESLRGSRLTFHANHIAEIISEDGR